MAPRPNHALVGWNSSLAPPPLMGSQSIAEPANRYLDQCDTGGKASHVPPMAYRANVAALPQHDAICE